MPALTTTSITPCLWFDDQLEEAARFYTRIFPNSAIGHLTRHPAGPDGPGRVMAGEFTLDGLTFRAVNGGPELAGFARSISFSVTCRDQAEVDRYWHALLADGGEESMCGWLTDRFGLSWQVVPARLYDLVSDPEPARADAAVRAMLRMRRIVVAELEAAADAAG